MNQELIDHAEMIREQIMSLEAKKAKAIKSRKFTLAYRLADMIDLLQKDLKNEIL